MGSDHHALCIFGVEERFLAVLRWVRDSLKQLACRRARHLPRMATNLAGGRCFATRMFCMTNGSYVIRIMCGVRPNSDGFPMQEQELRRPPEAWETGKEERWN